MDQPSARIDQAFEGNSTSCILRCGKLCDEANDSISSWETIKQKALLWSDLGNVYAIVDWDNGPAGQCVLGSPCVIPRNLSKLIKDTQKDLTKLSFSVHLSSSSSCEKVTIKSRSDTLYMTKQNVSGVAKQNQPRIPEQS